MSKDQLIADAIVVNDELAKLVDSLDETAMASVAFGDWSIVQLLAHIGGWQRVNAEMMERMARGEHPVPDGANYSDDDRMNASFADETHGKAIGEVIQSARDAFSRFTRAADSLPEARLAEGRFAARIVQGNGIDHVREHLGEIRVHLAKITS